MSEFRKYTREELVTFVRSMDRVIEEPTEILVIGGAAAALKYGATASGRSVPADASTSTVSLRGGKTRIERGMWVR